MKLEGKVALVTGTSPNIMGGIAEGLADEGADIICVDINATYAERCSESVMDKGRRSIAITCDVTDEFQVAAAVDQAQEAFGGVDILVNGATQFNTKGILEMSVKEWRRQTDILLTGAFLFTKLIAEQMIEWDRRGNMINIISTAGHQGEPGNIGYGTAKGGLLNFTRAVAMDLAKHGIRVNSLTPTATDRGEALERAKRWGVDWPGPRLGSRLPGWPQDPGAGLPLQKMPSPSHYGKAAAFLASDEAEMITGFDLRVDGGAIAKYWIWDPSSGAPI
ncbi:MAG: SDR family oxidoreductase [Chloroflexota bacterium]|nr:SDR family oxidoreductase [Chloroflexota bacterium]MEC9287635.1 SDR family oxidoreductase [Chloroflexota bacterium]MEE3246669.1 SDR family oxidoreductase [Chloroflexota bacterium]